MQNQTVIKAKNKADKKYIKLQLCSWQCDSQTMFLSTLFLFKMNRRSLEKQLLAEVKMKVSCQIAGGVGNTMQNCQQEKVKKRQKKNKREREGFRLKIKAKMRERKL